MLFMAMGTIHLETKLGITFLMLLMTPVSVFAFFVISLGVGFHFGEGIGLPYCSCSPFQSTFGLGLGRPYRVFGALAARAPRTHWALGCGFDLRSPGRSTFPSCGWYRGGATDLARSITKSILDMDMLKAMPVAERIGLEFTAWGSAAFVVLLALTFVGLSILGKLVEGRARCRCPTSGRHLSRSHIALGYDPGARRSELDVDRLHRRGRSIESPILGRASGVDSHPHECCKPATVEAAPPFDAQKSLSKGEKAFKDAELKIAAIEQRTAEDEKDKQKGGKDSRCQGWLSQERRQASQSAAGKPAGSGK